MFIKFLNDCEEFFAGDKSILREILHPQKADLKINYSLAHAIVRAGQKTLAHKLKASEVYYILEGRGRMHINNESAEVSCSQAVYIPPESVQYIENIGESDLKFICIVSPAWRPEDEQILQLHKMSAA